MTTTTSDDQLEALDRELLNAVQWDFPLEPRPLRGARRAPRHLRSRGARADRARSRTLGVLRQLSAIFDTRALGYGSALVAAQDRPRSHRRGRRGHQRAPRRQPQLQAQPRVQPLVHDRGAARRVARRAHRRAAPRVGRARHPQAADAEALQDRREARHDRQDRGQRQGRGARARAARAHEPTWRRPSCPTSRSRRSASCRRTCRSSSARSPRTAS